MKKTILKALTAVALVLSLTACGAPKTLEGLMTADVIQKETENVKQELLTSYGDVYSDYAMEVKENSIVYKYYYTADYTGDMVEALKTSLKDSVDWSANVNNVKDEIEKASKIRPDSISFIYYTADGEEVFNYTE
ncbi:MAG: hypothetical protein IK121_03345 [Lachnospiraceae bacterium]|jgi:hypothetical protein|nr:hypothetical protein [Lachnospiraceae bacterium]